MKKIMIFIAIFMIGCSDVTYTPSYPIQPSSERWWTTEESKNVFPPIRTVKIDGCEYLIADSFSAFAITHKGNCSNAIHKVNK